MIARPSDADVASAVAALGEAHASPAAALSHSNFPAIPGLYSWWADEAGAAELQRGLGVPLSPSRIYVGQAGATKWPSGKRGTATLRSRVGGQHLGGRIRNSTFRLTLGSILADGLGLIRLDVRKLEPSSEELLTRWIRRHLSIAVVAFPNTDALGELEKRVLDALDPPLNLDGRPPSDVRSTLSGLRSQPGSPSRRASPPPDDAPPQQVVPSGPVPAAATLHEELAAILKQSAGNSLTTRELADAVNERGKYVRCDGAALGASQVGARVRQYPHLFIVGDSGIQLKL